MAQTIVDRSVYVKIENWSEVNMLLLLANLLIPANTV